MTSRSHLLLDGPLILQQQITLSPHLKKDPVSFTENETLDPSTNGMIYLPCLVDSYWGYFIFAGSTLKTSNRTSGLLYHISSHKQSQSNPSILPFVRWKTWRFAASHIESISPLPSRAHHGAPHRDRCRARDFSAAPGTNWTLGAAAETFAGTSCAILLL